MSKPLLIIALDGCGPDYVEPDDHLPNLRSFAKRGFYKRVTGMMPSVTNVNNTSILTGTFPSEHGIASNYWYNPDTDTGGWIEAADYLQQRVYTEFVREEQGRSAFVSAKGKLQTLLGSGADISLSSEHVPDGLQGRFRAPPPLQSPENSYWVLEAAREIIRMERPDFVYATTTDYLMHHHAPADPASQAHMRLIDRAIGELAEAAHGYEIFVTADHGMGHKEHLINLQGHLDEAGVRCRVVLPIEDRYVENHPNEESGSAYVYAMKGQEPAPVAERLAAIRGVESVLSREDASERFYLPPDRIGDFLVLAEKETVFGASGNMSVLEMKSPVRSHGSVYEQEVPLFGLNSRYGPSELEYSLDIVRTRLAAAKA